MDATHLSQVRIGYVMMAKPKHFEPRPPNSTTIGQHPVVVLTGPDADGKVRVASMSHRHPDNPPQRAASYYNLPVDPVKGEGTISIGTPKIIHFSLLKPTNPQTMMSGQDFARLKADILQHHPGCL
ncbi:hypothetical protein CVT24_005027 [Panaeolus cyanescens]|uniref:Type II toxin-antitoxin system PemK/MazF family toxin n=1 Tax=Panaeolus cyanescens TaxID=181874 RepID=A0A409YB97_9AGAR|nr:hypothetical protein CVT24_005027 [Panaeolus cyanescens]